MDITQIREQYPQYSSLSDGELAFRLWNKDYKGSLPMGMFADRIKLPQDGFRQMVDFAEQSGYQPTTESGDRQEIGTGQGAIRSGFQGATFGFGDEIVGGLAGAARAAGNVLQGQPANLGGEVERFTEQERGRIEQFREESPVTSAVSEIGGAVASGLAAPAVRGAQALSPTARAAATGAASGAAFGAGTAEGGLEERARGAVELAIPSALFGAAGQQAVDLAGRGAQRVARAFNRSAQRPSVETLRSAKNAAYDAVDESGVVFDQSQLQNLAGRARQIADDFDYIDDPAVFPETYASLRILERRANAGETSIGRLDKLRQTLWKRYQKSGGAEPAVLGMIDEIDTLVQEAPATGPLMDAARAANSRFKKAQMLDDAVKKAELQTASTGSGGNILNKYRQAITSILTNPNRAKWFNDAEKQQMQAFIDGSFSENALRQIGKLSPTGNGLMAALNLGAAAVDPTMLGFSAAGAAAKTLSDRSGQRGISDLLDTVSGLEVPQPVQRSVPGLSSGGASALSQLLEENQ